jgi:hypothetical protein
MDCRFPDIFELHDCGKLQSGLLGQSDAIDRGFPLVGQKMLHPGPEIVLK